MKLSRLRKSPKEKHKITKGMFYHFAIDRAVVYAETDGFIYPSSGRFIDVHNQPLFSLDDRLYLWESWRFSFEPFLLFKCLIQEEIYFLVLEDGRTKGGKLEPWKEEE